MKNILPYAHTYTHTQFKIKTDYESSYIFKRCQILKIKNKKDLIINFEL